MKLYTEEQVKEAIILGRVHLFSNNANEIIEKLTPIEIPSDKEIEEGSRDYIKGTDLDTMVRTFFIAGAKWYKKQILNQNK